MKVIRPGVLPENVEIESTCRYCKCLFSYTKKEAFYRSDQRDGDYLEISCPTCARPVTLSVERFNVLTSISVMPIPPNPE